jgi:hypothetical protein
MKIKDMDPKAPLGGYLVRIPEDVEQIMEPRMTEGYLVSMFNSPGGWFMSPDPPGKETRSLIPCYGDPNGILEWEVIEQPEDKGDSHGLGYEED